MTSHFYRKFEDNDNDDDDYDNDENDDNVHDGKGNNDDESDDHDGNDVATSAGQQTVWSETARRNRCPDRKYFLCHWMLGFVNNEAEN